HHPDPDGREPARSAIDDADDGNRSGAAEDDDVHADHVHLHVPVGTVRSGAVLACQQSLDDRAAVRDELHHRTAGDPDDPSRGGTPPQAGRRWKDRSRGRAEELIMSDPTKPIGEFLEQVASAYGIDASVACEDTPDGPRFNFE